jgi:transposase
MRGYSGSDSLFHRFISQLRKQHQNAGTASVLTLASSGAHVHVPDDCPATPSPKRRLSPTRASWLCVCQSTKLDEKQRKQVEQVRTAHQDLDSAYQLSQAFVMMLAERRDQDLDGWLIQAKQSGIVELKSFAQGFAAITPLSARPSLLLGVMERREAQVNCLKLQKRLVFGRANFDLTRTACPLTGVDAPYEPVLNSCLWLYLLDITVDFC